jgi:hypothetical protein
MGIFTMTQQRARPDVVTVITGVYTAAENRKSKASRRDRDFEADFLLRAPWRSLNEESQECMAVHLMLIYR